MSTKITYNGKTTELADGYIATLPCKDYKMATDVVVEAPEPAEVEDSPLPIEVSTEAEMTALLTSGEVGGVYKYTGTTGTYENGALYVLEEEAAATITFTIDGTSYTAEEGMTFGDWIASSHNTGGFTQTSGSDTIKSTAGTLVAMGTSKVSISTLIESGYSYSLVSSTTSGPSLG